MLSYSIQRLRAVADPASVLEIYGCSLFIRFRNPSSFLRKSEATDGTMRPSEERVGIRGARAYHCSITNGRWRCGNLYQ
jgi:hypothetical protein